MRQTPEAVSRFVYFRKAEHLTAEDSRCVD